MSQTLNQRFTLSRHMQIDYAASFKEPLLRGETKPIDTKPGKVAAAIAWMGPLWVFHRKNKVKKLSEPLPEVFAWRPSKVLKARK